MLTLQWLSSRFAWVGLLYFLAVAFLSACDGEPTATPTPDSTLTTVPVPTLVPTPTPIPTVTPNLTPEPVYDVEKARAKLAAARDLWESKGSDDYTIEIIAFLGLSRVPMRLTVRNGVIESAKFLEGFDSGMPVPPSDIYHVPTIDGLFDKIEEALSDRLAWSMGAEYDAELGYPREFRVSYTDIPDDYFEASICCYNPLATEPSGVNPDAPSQAAGSPTPSVEGRP